MKKLLARVVFPDFLRERESEIIVTLSQKCCYLISSPNQHHHHNHLSTTTPIPYPANFVSSIFKIYVVQFVLSICFEYMDIHFDIPGPNPLKILTLLSPEPINCQ